ncbi:N-methylhydantoinase A [Bacillus thermophilus]|uniref:N-methylhydantoinase A n=1 Tax=Siminovitchia thermophila TaxID=1245522 RepID=A0ABS2R765_9BACI|nr:hydantoinase/oxoprolinase family protein [Siminovitchia thermophila]MBM7714994.1 N-methylhydantoinase A [Siminovitchia thermophila]ONK22363.1 5-oxoprolinase [Bacillus sp. VT-16-64]
MRVATDIGGTFTDLVYIKKNGEFGIAKDHTTPGRYERGILNAIQKSGISPGEIDMFIHGSTVVINTLTERKGVKVGLITTKGMRDVLEIARGNRPDLYNFKYKKPKPFVERHLRLEVAERLNYKGEVLVELHESDLKRAIEYFRQEGVEAIAIVFLHSYKNPVHEQMAKAYIQKHWPEVYVTASFEISKEWREYERTNTTVLNSYVKPIATEYINNLKIELENIHIDGTKYIMQSNGGSTTFEHAKNDPIQMVESGPVAGIYGAKVLGELIGEKNMIAFDIGGTTAKCSLIHQSEVKITTDYYIEKTDTNAGYPIKAPVVDIVEIGNGGGSIAWIDELGSLQVGPQSAGAYPGPVAYGLGGESPTTTDAHLVTGRLSPKYFDYDVDMEKVKQVIKEQVSAPFQVSTEEGALGIIQIANSNMLNALRLISVRKGYDPSEFVMIAYGGGGSMHAAILGKELGVKKVIIPVSSAVFSAWGMLQTDLRRDYIQTYVEPFEQLDLQRLNHKWKEIESVAAEEFMEEGMEAGSILFTRYLDMRYAGQEHSVKVPVPNGDWSKENRQEIIERFHELHEQHYTFKLPDTDTEIVNIHVTGFGQVDKISPREIDMVSKRQNPILEVRDVYFEQEGWLPTKVYAREYLGTDAVIQGPAIIEEKQTSTVLYPGQTLTVDKYGNLIIETGV